MELNLETTHVLNTRYTTPKFFVIIGAGGTGGYYIPQVLRQISIQNKLRAMEEITPHRVVIIDGDLVEPHNLNRQNFIEPDVGRYKSEVLAERYGNAFGVEVEYLTQYITDEKMLFNIASDNPDYIDNTPVLVDCVDNNKTRVFMRNVANDLRDRLGPCFFISSGNEQYNGQVVCSYKGENSSPTYTRGFTTPDVIDMFPEVGEGNDRLPTELSCDEAAVSAPQNIMTNVMAANLLFNFSNIILTANQGNPENPGLKYFAITFDTQTGAFHTFRNKVSVIKKFIEFDYE